MLVILSPGFPADEEDTTCLPAVQQFVKAVSAVHPKNEIIVLSFQYPFFKEQYFWNGIRVISLGGKNRKGIYKLLTWIRALTALSTIHRKTKITKMLACWLTECAFITKLFAQRKKIKYYFWLHGQDAKKGNRYVKLIRPKENKLIAISEFIREEFQRNHKIRPFMIAENGITQSLFPQLNNGPRTIDILGVGSLIHLKNYELFEIIEVIKDSFPRIQCIIVGNGPEEKTLREFAGEKAPGLITFAGELKHTEVLDLMNNSKIFLHTSLFEGNASVLIEALYSGCQVVSTQNLKDENIENFYLERTKKELVKRINNLLLNTPQQKRVLFNAMEKTAKRILDLFQ